jgi:hypothetical protein
VAAETNWVRAALVTCDPRVVEVSSVFAVPYSLPPWGGHDHIRYQCVAAGTDGPIYLRSHGTEFNILPRPWLGQQIDGCFSIGPGLVDERQRTVVLAQVFRGNENVLAALARDGRWPVPPLVEASKRYGMSCLLLSGYL